MLYNIVIIFVVTVALIVLIHSLIFNFYQKKYYNDAYNPKIIKLGEVSKYPKEYTIEGINGISSEKQYQEAVALKMINDKFNSEKDVSIDNINFFMGYTYGTSFNLLNKTFIPFAEPTEGTRIAAPFMGFNMEYHVSQSVKAFLNAVRYNISQGYPVLLQLNMASLYNKKGFYPHCELLIGYNETGFYYYEVLGKNNKEKRFVESKKIIDAVFNLNFALKKPWRYGFSIFTAAKKNDDIYNVIKRNGDKLIGENSNKIVSGAKAIQELANHIRETKIFKDEWILETLKYSRSDNAKFLEQYLKNDFRIGKAANLFRKSSENYDKALKIIKANLDEKNVVKVSDLLIESSRLEEEVGIILKSFNEKECY